MSATGSAGGVRWTGLLAAFSVLACTPAIVALFGWLWWPLELTMHFHGCYALGLSPLALLLWVARQRRVAAFVTLVAVVDAAHVAPLYFPAEQAPAATPTEATVRILFANVYTQNRDRRRLLDLIAKESPDCIALFEVDADWLADLEVLDGDYPWHAKRARVDNFGIAFWSRHPCTTLEVLSLGDAGVPSVHADLRVDSGPSTTSRLTVLATHPIPPVFHRAPTARDQQMRAIAKFVAALPHRAVVVGGDLNTSSWTPIFRELCEQGQLRDSRRGFGLQPTWPGRLATIGIAIDHALVGEALAVRDRRVGPPIGSDHRPILIDVCALEPTARHR